MFKPFHGQCIDCPKGIKSFIVVKAMRCARHNHEFKLSKKPLYKIIQYKLKQARSKLRKVTGEKDVFDKIWKERLHRCEVCTRPIIRKKDEVGMFSHVLSKGASTITRLDEDFILLMGDGLYPNCFCHRKWENRTEEMRNIEMWKPIFLLLDYAKQQSHKRRKNKPLYNEKYNSQSNLEGSV